MYYNQTMPYFPSPANLMVPREHHVLKVSGEGNIYAVPDLAIIILGVITENPNLQAAQTENARIISNVIDSLLQLGLPKEKIKTTAYRIDMHYDYHEGKETFQGYKVTHLLQVTIDQIEQTGRIVDTAVSNGANSVTNIQFSVKHPEIYYNQALSLAITESLQKAMTMAKTLGVTLNPIPNQVQEVSSVSQPIPLQSYSLAKSAQTPIQPGELKISAAVQADYSYSAM